MLNHHSLPVLILLHCFKKCNYTHSTTQEEEEEQWVGLKSTEQPTTMDGVNASELGMLHFVLLVNVTEACIGIY